MNIDEMTPREMDAAIATHLFGSEVQYKEFTRVSPSTWSKEKRPVCLHKGRYRIVRLYSTSRDATHEVEQELKRRNLEHHYILELMAIVAPEMAVGGTVTYGELWAIATATPMDRCKAALRVVMNNGIIK